jgi:cupin fold WbuC family metalloprotein
MGAFALGGLGRSVAARRHASAAGARGAFLGYHTPVRSTFIAAQLAAARHARRWSVVPPARRRKNHNFHPHETHVCSRLLNAIEPGSYIVPHRHLDPAKGESAVVLRGRLGVVLFDDVGCPVETALLEPSGEVVGVDVPPGIWHTPTTSVASSSTSPPAWTAGAGRT